MISSSGRFVISYNGEIYNHLKLREELKHKVKINWKSKSDTETILEMFEIFGIVPPPFAFAFRWLTISFVTIALLSTAFTLRVTAATLRVSTAIATTSTTTTLRVSAAAFRATVSTASFAFSFQEAFELRVVVAFVAIVGIVATSTEMERTLTFGPGES